MDIIEILNRYWPPEVVDQIIDTLEMARGAWDAMSPEDQARMAQEVAYVVMRSGSLSRVMAAISGATLDHADDPRR